MSDTTLLHCCCAPCSVRCIEDLRAEGIEPTAYWYNPTIHPYQEYKARRDTLIGYAPTIDMVLVVDEDYGLRPFVQAVAADIEHRCRYCYACRLDRTARYAAENGFSSFSGISVPVSGMVMKKPKRWGFTCRNTAAVFSARKNATAKRSPGT